MPTTQPGTSTEADNTEAFPRIRLGVSACLLGEPVRYDGGHKHHAFLTDTLAAYADYLPFCPETAIGLGVPRPPIHLVGDPTNPRALGVQDPSLDVTEPLKRYATAMQTALATVSGVIFKKYSPSCGLRLAENNATGIFAQSVRQALPLLPLEEEDALDNPRRLENFLTRVYVFRRWQDLCATDMSVAALLDFHAVHKYLVMGHSQAAYRHLGQLLSNLSKLSLEDTANAYIPALMSLLKRPGRRPQHFNVLQHLAGYLKPHLDHEQMSRLGAQLEAYRQGSLPLIEAMTSLKVHFERFPHPFIHRQVYLRPYPHSLSLHISTIKY